MKEKIVTFGEIMLRLSKPSRQRLSQGHVYTENYGGSEANVSVSLATLDDNVEYITRVPDNTMGRNVCMKLNEYNVSTDHVVLGGDRVGTYFFEEAAAMRNSGVVDDRNNSSFYSIEPQMVDWENILADAAILHTSGISAGVSNSAFWTTYAGIHTAKKLGVMVSFDINYRKNLWHYGVRAEDVLPDLCKNADIIFGDQGEYEKISGLPRVPFEATDDRYEIDLAAFDDYMRRASAMYPRCKKFVMAARNQISSNHHTLTGFIYADGKLYHTRIYDIDPVIDPMGVGDAFIAAYLHAYIHWKDDNQHCLDFSLAASAMKNNVVGDFNLVTETEIDRLMTGDNEDFKVYSELQ